MKALSSRIRFVSPWLGGLMVVIVVGGSAVAGWQQRQAASNILSNPQTVLVKRQDLVLQIQAGGIAQAERATNLSPEGSGKIEALFIKEGDAVTQGQVIARMVSRRNQAEVDQARAALAQVQAEVDQQQFGALDEEIVQAQARAEASKAAVKVAQAALNKARSELSRFQQLADQGAVSVNELDTYLTTEQQAIANLIADEQRLKESEAALVTLRNGTRPEEIAKAKAAVAQAEAQLAVVQTQLDDTVVIAPFDGIITRRFAETGDFVSPATAASSDDGAASTSIAELSSGLEIEAKVPEANIAKLRRGQSVEIRSAAYSDEVFKGEISLVAPRAIREEQVTVFRVKVKLLSGQDQLKAGMTTRLIFLGEPVKDALVIPLAAVVTKPTGETGVYVAANEADEPAFKVIKIGATVGAQVEVVEGVKAGDRILIEPPPGEIIEGVDTPSL
jgi:HlyD family secretion protein